MNAAQKLANRAERRERPIVGAFLQIAETVGMTPSQVATSIVIVYADVGTKPVRVWAYNLTPAPELRTQGPRVTFACDRARLIEVWAERRERHRLRRERHAHDHASERAAGGILLAALRRWRTRGAELLLVGFDGCLVRLRCRRVRGDISRAEALAVSRNTEAECPEFWDRVSRETGGPLSDDERVEFLRAVWQSTRETEAEAN